MKQRLTFNDVERLLAHLRVSRPREDCWSCDCLQGLLTQLELDASEGVANLVGRFKVSPSQMHGCLGCKPLPPAGILSHYVRSRTKTEDAD